MDRRRFLHLGAAGSLSIPLLSKILLAPLIESAHPLELPTFLGQHANHQELLQIGRGYCRKFPAEANPETLVSAVQDRLALPSSHPEMALRLQQTIQEDFQLGEVLQLNGWILSRTEARQCALFSLTNV